MKHFWADSGSVFCIYVDKTKRQKCVAMMMMLNVVFFVVACAIKKMSFDFEMMREQDV